MASEHALIETDIINDFSNFENNSDLKKKLSELFSKFETLIIDFNESTKKLDKLTEEIIKINLLLNSISLELNSKIVKIKMVDEKIQLKQISKMCIKIKNKSSSELHEIPINENGDVLVEEVNTIFKNAVCLSYPTRFGTIRVCPKKGNIFTKPEDGWKAREYTVHY